MYQLNEKNECIIANYQTASPFSSFLPGIAGLKGIPLWSFYVNRGQAIASFGIENKDGAIAEFFPADKAYQFTPLQGFRTFLKVTRNGNTKHLEPFGVPNAAGNETMKIGMNHIELTYENPEEKVAVHVRYYILPNAPIGALVREVRMTNANAEPIQLELADGLAAILPAGITNAGYKEIGNTLKSWFDVKTVDNRFNFYHLRGSTEDTEDVKEIHSGNFYASLIDDEKAAIIYDRDLIFGHDQTLRTPQHFLHHNVNEIKLEAQIPTNKSSGGFTLWGDEVASGQTITLQTLVGYGKDEATIASFLEQHFNAAFLDASSLTAQTLTAELTAAIQTKTADSRFDSYARQSYLDNGLRGGFPTVHSHDGKHKTYYVYSRKHGDLERDYNFFSTSPTYYSQGNGNYRDINQNRRMDVFFTPEVGDDNLHHFMELIQLDGYNPLVIKKVRYTFNGDSTLFLTQAADNQKLVRFFQQPFEPGELLAFLKENNITLNSSFEAYLAFVLSESTENLEADHGEGFWIDHWTYNTDLIESYLSLYPDKKQELFFERPYKYYQNKAFVEPRAKKHIKHGERFRQFHAVRHGENETSQWVQTPDNQPPTTTLYAKLVLLTAVKAATIAPFGYGIAMEAGKPGWNDSLNGLPGLFGASTSELYELKRLMTIINAVDGPVTLPIEATRLLDKLQAHFETMTTDDQAFWDRTTTLLENYRADIYHGLSGEWSTLAAKPLLAAITKRVDEAVTAVEAYNGDGLLPTYFYFDKEADHFSAHAVTPFLEGIVKKMKVTANPVEARQLYEAVRKSEIFDRKLNMYKTSTPLTDEPIELGRAKFFTRGWLENESVFLHMSYKYLLEILKSGLYEEFYEDSQTMLIPNLDPAVYGRSILENSSFIASSANPDPSIHGKGFVARLSGSTVEFLEMWVRMFIGETPFTYTDQLGFQLRPVLHQGLFQEDGTVQFKLFGAIDVTYVNETKQNTYGKDGVRPVRYTLTYLDDHEIAVEGEWVDDQGARAIRNKEVKSIRVTLA
ncbi:hypothetical protein [Jeotgalibaca sp. A122]|uniref:hypothetical protein n=1 Tax=Jeotgalibaca sp. A122 TaxID=3457322 RepID=UPI003FD45BF4